MTEPVKKRIVVGLTARAEWVRRFEAFLADLVDVIGLELDEKEQGRLSALPEGLAKLIYAGALDSVMFELGEETCEIEVVYHPSPDEQDDLDLSLLWAVDWNVEALSVQVRVDDPEYASAVAGEVLQGFSSDRLSLRLVRAGSAGGRDVVEADDGMLAEGDGQQVAERKEA